MAPVVGRSSSPRRRRSGSGTRRCRREALVLASVWFAVLFVGPHEDIHAQETLPTGEQRDGGALLSEQVDLARLLDLCSQRLKLNLEYDPAVVRVLQGVP